MWAALVFGWPSAILSVLFGALGVMSQQWKWTLAGALIGSPFLLYLSLSPRSGWIAMLVAISYGAAVAATFRERPRLARSLFAPMVALVAWVAWAVAAQP